MSHNVNSIDKLVHKKHNKKIKLGWGKWVGGWVVCVNLACVVLM